MSVDAEVWVRRVHEFRPALFAVSEAWRDSGGELAVDGGGWQILVAEPETADVADADPTLTGHLDGSEQLVAVTLEPSGAPFEAFALLADVVSALVNRAGGAALDVETGEVLTAP
jgi:hypothetical protein